MHAHGEPPAAVVSGRAQRRAGASPDARATPPLRLLMIARDFPPANSSAALRALSLAEQLDRRGGAATVVSVRPARHAARDRALLDRLPAACAVQPAFGVDTKLSLALAGRYPCILAFPDRDASWFPDAVRHAVRAHRRTPCQAMLSTSPPVTAHCIAAMVHRLTGIPWIAELRDPWNLTAPRSRLFTRLDGRLERRVYAAAQRIVVTTDNLAAALRSAHGSAAAKVHVVPNGYDETDFAGAARDPAPDPRFTIVHAGACTPPYRDPAALLAALRGGLDGGDLPADTRLVFLGAGATPAPALAAAVRRTGLDAHVAFGDRIPHAEAIAAMRRASVLLLLQDQPMHRDSVPQKAYEYLRSGRIVLAIAPAASATAALVRGRAGVFLAAPEHGAELAEQLTAACRSWRAEPRRIWERDVAAYERRCLAARLIDLLQEIRRDRPAASDIAR